MKGMTQNLLIDIGNTNVHCALINGEVVGKSLKLATDLFESMNFKEDFNLGFGKRTLVSSVRHISDSLKIRIDGFFNNVLYLSPDLRWPFKSDYKTPKTLGPDRVASVAGAQKIFPETARSKNLVILLSSTFPYKSIVPLGLIHEKNFQSHTRTLRRYSVESP